MDLLTKYGLLMQCVSKYVSLTSSLYDMLIRKVGISFPIPGTNLQTVSSLGLESLNGRPIPFHTSDIFQLEDPMASSVLENLDVKWLIVASIETWRPS